MNSKSQVFAIFIFIGLIFLIVAFSLITPFKEALDETRQQKNLNCLGTSDFSQVNFTNQSTFEKLNKRTTCFATGISFFWFYVAWIMAVVVWVVKQIRKKR